MRAQKFLTLNQERRKWVAATALFQPHSDDSWLLSSPCNTESLILRICEKESYMQRVTTEGKRGRQKIDVLCKVGEPSFQAVRLCDIDIRRFKKCLYNTLTQYRESESGCQPHRYISLCRGRQTIRLTSN